jgi:hypothetical protein
MRSLSLTALVAVLCAVGFAALRSHTNDVQAAFGLANVLGLNDESHLSVYTVDDLLGHAQMLLLGMAVLSTAEGARCVARLLEPRGSRLAGLLPVLAPVALVTAVVLVLAVSLILHRSSVVDGQRFFFLVDDAMSSMRYAKNFAEGRGLVFNVGERVEGYTNFLWVIVMAAIHRAGAGPALAPMWLMALSWGLVALTAWLVVDLVRANGMGPVWAACAGLLVACDRNTLTWAASGLETSALVAAATTCAWAIARGKTRTFALALMLVPLLRADGLVLGVALGAAFLFHRREWRAARALAPAGVVTAAHFVFRRAYYDHWLPNTYYLRMIDLGDRLQTGLGGYALRLFTAYPVFLGLALACALLERSPRALRALAPVAFFQAAYSVYLGGDIFPELRFVAPVLPLFYVCALSALRDLLGGAEALARDRVAQAFALACCPVLSPNGRLGKPADSDGFFRSSLETARMLEHNVPEGALVTVYPAGTTPYYASRLRFVDVFGKNDEHIAHQPAYVGFAIGHNKFDFDYVYGRKPDVALVFASCQTIDEFIHADAAGREAIRERVPYLKQVPLIDIDRPSFERDYYPNRVRYPKVRVPAPTDCAFVRRDSGIPVLWSD